MKRAASPRTRVVATALSAVCAPPLRAAFCGPEGRKLLAAGEASVTSATTGSKERRMRPEGGARTFGLTNSRALPGRIGAFHVFRWLRSLYSLHHRLPAFGPPGQQTG